MIRSYFCGSSSDDLGVFAVADEAAAAEAAANELTEAIANAKSLTQADRLHGVWVRNNLARDLHEDVEALEPSSASILDATDDYSELAAELPTQYYKRYVDLIRRTYEEKWQPMLEDLLRYK